MRGIDRGSDRAILKARQEHGLPPVPQAELSDEEENDDATTTGSKSPRAWANAKSLATQQVRQAAKGTSGVSLIWLVEWGIRNEIDGYAEWFVRCAKGQRTVEAVSLPFKGSSAFSSSLFVDLCSGCRLCAGDEKCQHQCELRPFLFSQFSKDKSHWNCNDIDSQQ